MLGSEVDAILGRIKITGPFGHMGWQWHHEPSGHGTLVWATFFRWDRETKEYGPGVSRREYISWEADESSVVKTAWVIFELTMRHEAMESFRVDGVLVFDPHRPIATLKALAGAVEAQTGHEATPDAQEAAERA